MYQFYYADTAKVTPHCDCKLNIAHRFKVTAIRPAMWEEHCLECAAPVCFRNCAHYQARSDGRCKRFDNGISVYPDEKACCGQGAHLKFRKWANMMTIIFPSMLSPDEYGAMTKKNAGLGKHLKRLAECPLPEKLRFTGIRTAEWLRRRGLRNHVTAGNEADAFLFHGYSYSEGDYRLIMEIYNDHTPVFKTALLIRPGENMYILDRTQLSAECQKSGNLVKIYPENDVEGELDILWCDFVQGYLVENKADCKPAPTVKCVVWDLDNTVWDGVLIETDDPASLQPKKEVLDMFRALDERGVIQSVASKNSAEQTISVLEKMGIAEYFLYPQIHWNAKSTSIAQIAGALNIGIDACVLIDDSAFERNEVQSAYPQVRVYDPSELSMLLQKPEFQMPITEESRRRREMYRAEEKRLILQNESNDGTVEFLKKCHLCTTMFTPSTEEEFTRCYELVSRTNQLNMSGKKYTTEEFREVLARSEHRNLAFSCEDDFGSYGIVGFMQYKVDGDAVIFTEFAMSCRVAGKYVESAVFTRVLKDAGCTEGHFAVIKTKKNVLLRNTLQKIGFSIAAEQSDSVAYRFDSDLENRELIPVELREE